MKNAKKILLFTISTLHYIGIHPNFNHFNLFRLPCTRPETPKRRSGLIVLQSSILINDPKI